MRPLPTPGGVRWPQMLTQWLSQQFGDLDREIDSNRSRSIGPGTIALVPDAIPLLGELRTDGQLVAQSDYPTLYATIGSAFNNGPVGAGLFRLPNIASPGTGLHYRIKTGA